MYATAVGGSSSSNVSASDLPEHYSKIQFPEYKYVAPYPKDFRVEIAEGITGYIVSDRSLPLVDFTVYFEENNLYIFYSAYPLRACIHAWFVKCIQNRYINISHLKDFQRKNNKFNIEYK